MKLWVKNEAGEEYTIEDDVVFVGVETKIGDEVVLVEMPLPYVSTFTCEAAGGWPRTRQVDSIVVLSMTTLSNGETTVQHLTRYIEPADLPSRYAYRLRRP